MYSRPHLPNGSSASAPDVHLQMEYEPTDPPSGAAPRRPRGVSPDRLPDRQADRHADRHADRLPDLLTGLRSSLRSDAPSAAGASTIVDIPPLKAFSQTLEWVDDVARQCASHESMDLATRLRQADHMAEATFLDMLSEEDADDLDGEAQRLRNASSSATHRTPPLPGRDVQRNRDPLRECAIQVENYLSDGNLRGLPADLQRAVQEATDGARPGGPSGRLMAVLAGLRSLCERMDETGAGRTLLNFGHTTVRSLGSVGLTTLARQAVGRAIDLALTAGTSELTRTLIGAGAMGLPILGQLALLWRDEHQHDATPYSRATRAVLMGLCLGTCGLAVATGTLTNPGLRLAEVVLYTLLRDGVQARFPIMSDPDSGPTKRSLVAAGSAYAVNQLGVSRAFAAGPDVNAAGLLASGLTIRSLANAAGESVDLMTLLYGNHITRHGSATVPRLRIGSGDVLQALRTPLHWDTMAARGCFVAGFNQLYDTMLADHTLTQALRSVVGEEHAFTAADWLTELTAGVLTALTYPFWTDPVHARGFSVPPLASPTSAQSTAQWTAAQLTAQLTAMEEGKGAPSPAVAPPPQGRRRAPVQYAGNGAEPAVATDTSGVTLLNFVDETNRQRGSDHPAASGFRAPTAGESPWPA